MTTSASRSSAILGYAFFTVYATLFATVPGCKLQNESVRENASLREALTFYASFDGSVNADVAMGDSTLYSAPSWGRRNEGIGGMPGDSIARHVEGRGKYGHAIEFVVSRPHILYFNAKDNVAYKPENWGGTISVWLSLDPDEDLAPGYSDPLQISSKNWNDAALFVDFTRDDTPRHFRFAAFADQDIWNPSQTDWDDIAADERPMVDVPEPPFSRNEWTHVVMTFEKFNTGGADAIVTAYLNGERYGSITDREQTFTWDPEEAIIALGINYVGLVDDLSIYNRPLTAEEVRTLHGLEDGIASFM